MITTEQINNAPTTMGVYIFYEGTIPLYIGKSIHLRARIKSHFAETALSKKEKVLFERSTHIDYTVVLSEFDALLLEAKLIKIYKPQYNIELKDDKHYLYIKIPIREPFPKIVAVRRENDGKSLYFGPFSSTRTTRELLSVIRRIIPFCTQTRITHRACFYAKIGLCNPCPNTIHALSDTHVRKKAAEMYRKNIQRVINLLSGKPTAVYRQFKVEIERAIRNQDYEAGMAARKRLQLLDHLLSNKTFGPEYESLFVPDEGIIWTELKNFLYQYLHINLQETAVRIECFDISNLAGAHATASMVVFERDQMNKKEYRRFRIKTVHKISDFDMVEEVLSRRFAREGWASPTLIVIDGGKPQVRAALRALEKTGEKCAIIGIAKHPDRVVTAEKTIYLPRDSVLFKTFVSLRDEAHRFAKKYHLHLRAKDLL